MAQVEDTTARLVLSMTEQDYRTLRSALFDLADVRRTAACDGQAPEARAAALEQAKAVEALLARVSMYVDAGGVVVR